MDNRDFHTCFYILKKLYEKYPYEIASYCLMTNHYHLQLRSQQHSISKIMALTNKKCVNYYNIRYNLTGHVFEKRFLILLLFQINLRWKYVDIFIYIQLKQKW
ncbi:transposase [Metabacillus litoralis]|uniref:transposase n=1 Tax=Metabacillus litoralis TaxID=152268 RepID=UPI001EFFADF7|nr:transposase [Metabacillus litoralis]